MLLRLIVPILSAAVGRCVRLKAADTLFCSAPASPCHAPLSWWIDGVGVIDFACHDLQQASLLSMLVGRMNIDYPQIVMLAQKPVQMLQCQTP